MDTLEVENGNFTDTIRRDHSQYNYIKLSSWEWPQIVYLTPGNHLQIIFENKWVTTNHDRLNEYLLNRDSLLVPYTARWDIDEVAYREIWQNEFPLNLSKIEEFFEGSDVAPSLIDEVVQMEYIKWGHRTANYISYQEKKDISIDRSIYHFVDSMDLNNERLSFHINNRNFQYYYYLNKIKDEVPDSIYPFAVIDTIKKNVSVLDIREMIINIVVKSGLHDESVDHDALFLLYDQEVREKSRNDNIQNIYNTIQSLKPGNKAPDFGDLIIVNGDTISIEDYKGKNILISAWGTWCPYCKEEIPFLNSMLDKYPDKLTSVAISIDKDESKWKEYIDDNRWNSVHLHDPNSGSTFKKNYLISGTNIHYLIDKDGVIVSSKLNPSDSRLDSLVNLME